jgi:HD-like signal output (HDOD) protein
MTIAQQVKSIDALLRRVKDISTLPQVALQVMEVAKNPQAGAGQLKAVIEGDPSLSARVLKLVNSAAYGARVTVTNLQQAISYLGFNQVRNLALTGSVSQIFKGTEKIGSYERNALWRHLVSVGICARLVAIRCRLAQFEDAFLAGLLHDLGIVIEDQHAHQPFRRMMAEFPEQTSLCALEQQYLGFDHCMLGSRLAEEWGFPETVRAAMQFHHCSHQYSGDDSAIVRCVEIANAICTIKGITSVGQRLIRPPLEALRTMGFGREDVIILATDLDREIATSESLFEL